MMTGISQIHWIITLEVSMLDKLGAPTYINDFAQNVKLLLEKEYWGLYNMVCRGIIGCYEVAIELVGILGLSDLIKVTSVAFELERGVLGRALPRVSFLIINN